MPDHLVTFSELAHMLGVPKGELREIVEANGLPLSFTTLKGLCATRQDLWKFRRAVEKKGRHESL
jgi:hypothetical protein